MVLRIVCYKKKRPLQLLTMIRKPHIVILFLLFLCVSINLSAQSQLIPYRVANKWGLADTLGKMVLPASYDEVQFRLYKNDHSLIKVNTYNLPWNVFYTKKNGLYGVAGSKEIIKPLYSKIVCVEQAYFLAFGVNELTEIYNLKGKLILPKGYTYNRQIWSTSGEEYTGYDAHFIFDVDDSLGNRCVYYYNSVNPALSGVLISNCFDIDAKSSSGSDDGMILQLRKRDTYGYSFVKIDYDVRLKRLSVVKKGETIEDMRSKGSDGYGYGNGSADGWDVDAPMVPNEDFEAKSRITIKKGFFMWKFGKLSIESREQVNVNGRYQTINTTVPIQLPNGASNVQVDYFQHGYYESSYKVQTDSGLFTIHNYVKFNLNGKQYLLLGTKPMEQGYDSIKQIYNPSMPEGQRFQFVVAIRNASNQLEFGLIDLEGKIIIPLQYQKLDCMKDQKPDGRRLYLDGYWLVKKENKFGLMYYNQKEIVPMVYDSIYLKCGYLEASTYYVLKKDNLYSAFVPVNQQPYLNNDHRYIKVPLVLKHPVSDVLYLPGKNRNSSRFLLLELRNEKGDLIGYTNVKGFSYFKD